MVQKSTVDAENEDVAVCAHGGWGGVLEKASFWAHPGLSAASWPEADSPVMAQRSVLEDRFLAPTNPYRLL